MIVAITRLYRTEWFPITCIDVVFSVVIRPKSLSNSRSAVAQADAGLLGLKQSLEHCFVATHGQANVLKPLII